MKLIYNLIFYFFATKSSLKDTLGFLKKLFRSDKYARILVVYFLIQKKTQYPNK